MADLEFNSILLAIKNEIGMQLVKTAPMCRTMFATHAVNDVLEKYDATQYERRGSGGGGIEDEKSYEVTVNVPELTMTIESTATGNPRYEKTDGYDPGYITDIIESGEGYNWKRSVIYKEKLPRPWMEEAGDDFVDNLLPIYLDGAMARLLGTEAVKNNG